MRIEEAKVHRVLFDREVYDALELIDNELGAVYKAFEGKGRLVSVETGCCVDIEELCRVRGILELFNNYVTFEWQY